MNDDELILLCIKLIQINISQMHESKRKKVKEHSLKGFLRQNKNTYNHRWMNKIFSLTLGGIHSTLSRHRFHLSAGQNVWINC